MAASRPRVRKPRQRPQGGYRLPGAVVTRRPASDVRAKCWTAMRIAVRFDVPHLMVTAEATRGNAADYVLRLADAGYLLCIRKGSGAAKTFSVYQLVRNTGPLAPITRKTGVVSDPNTKTTYGPGGSIVSQGETDGRAAP